MNGKLTTHVLDTAQGKPAAGVRIDLFRVDGDAPTFMKSVATNADGRAGLLEGHEMAAGTYQLLFYIADYFAGQKSVDAGKFLVHIPIVFVIGDADAKYHVPLLVSPWSYSTYRGS
jgi:5-hydroxyisourate hydrolase